MRIYARLKHILVIAGKAQWAINMACHAPTALGLAAIVCSCRFNVNK